MWHAGRSSASALSLAGDGVLVVLKVISLLGMMLLTFSPGNTKANADLDACEISKAVIHNLQPSTISNPPPEIDRLAIESDYAIALWRNGVAGGVAVLRKGESGWTILANGGGSMNAQGLVDAGVPKATASRLIKDIGI